MWSTIASVMYNGAWTTAILDRIEEMLHDFDARLLSAHYPRTQGARRCRPRRLSASETCAAAPRDVRRRIEYAAPKTVEEARSNILDLGERLARREISVEAHDALVNGIRTYLGDKAAEQQKNLNAPRVRDTVVGLSQPSGYAVGIASRANGRS
jgi:hypothetical protein